MIRPKKKAGFRYVISVLVRDRVGILRDISAAVTRMSGNIDGLSQTVVAGYFTVILTATFAAVQDRDRIRDNILRHFDDGEASVVVRIYRVRRDRGAGRERENYVLTITGPDRRGVVNTVTSFLSGRDINIEDWFMNLQAGQGTYVGEVSVPVSLDIKNVQEQLQRLLARSGLRASLQHENLFRATNEVGAVSALIRRRAGGVHAKKF